MIAKSMPFHSHRIAWSRVAVALVFVYAVLIPSPALLSQPVLEFLELLGFILLSVAALGRLWCLSYISGYKNEVLLTEGPYSVMRNPLYLFNFIGGIGLGLAVENPLLAALLVLGFLAFYPGVVRREEARLAQQFGETYARYCEATPRWIPRWSNFHEPETWTIFPRRFRAGLLSTMWFLWVFLLWEVFEELRLLEWFRGL
ncbi:MAG TPA: isoprenylcysteine carboxylmethyltransferase family protein [Burkholderiales bacterium]|jgi:protein-S-isoprenylcysteine O-methyltransferase Ste14